MQCGGMYAGGKIKGQGNKIRGGKEKLIIYTPEI